MRCDLETLMWMGMIRELETQLSKSHITVERIGTRMSHELVAHTWMGMSHELERHVGKEPHNRGAHVDENKSRTCDTHLSERSLLQILENKRAAVVVGRAAGATAA